MTLARQYVAKLATNIVALFAGLVTLAIVPRGLGPEAFGRYEFLANFFQQSKSFFDMGTSICFYTRLSQDPGDRALVIFYRKLVFSASVLIVGAGAILPFTPVGAWLWVGEATPLIAMAAILACLMWWLDSARKMVDAYRLTVAGEGLYALSRVIAAAVLLIVVWQLGLTISGYFAFLICATLASILILELLMARRRPAPTTPGTKSSGEGFLKDFWDYSHPLLLYALVGVSAGLADRWILQTHAGAIEQGYFGLAYQVGAVCFLFTGAMTQLLTREFAVAWSESDLSRMRELFRRVVPILYAVAAYFCVFVAFHAEDVAFLVGGKQFEQGAAALAIMALYPMHQTYGQLSGSIFYATGQTRLYRNMGIIGAVAGLPLMLWLIATPQAGGMGLGATGLAAKTLLLQAVMVNVGLWFNARLLGLGFWKFVAHQIVAPLLFAACVLIAMFLVNELSLPRIGRFLLTGVLYSALVVAAVWILPGLAGLSRSEMLANLRRLKV